MNTTQRPRSEQDRSHASLPRYRGMRASWITAIMAGLMLLTVRAYAQEGTWRGLDVPQYTGSTHYVVRTDHDEYKMYFYSSDSPQKVFDFYRGYLEDQGFHVTRTKSKRHGFKAHLQRAGGSASDRVELDAKLKHGQYKVEIEFDE